MNPKPLPDAAPAFEPPDWQAAWIDGTEVDDGHHVAIFFRRSFELDAVSGRALLRWAAERDGAIWLNGELLSYGPPISDPRFKRYETLEVTGQLRVGQNSIAIRLYADKAHAAMTAHATARGVLCQLELDGAVVVATDEQWKARHSRGLLRPGGVMGDCVYPEFYDARQDPADWQSADFDDSGWPAARRVTAPTHGLWGSQQPQARFYPWVNLVPSETRPLRRETIRPISVTAGEVLQRRQASPQDTAVRMSLEFVEPLDKTRIVDADALLTGDNAVMIENSSLTEPDDTFDGLRNATLVLDFGRLMNARLNLSLDAPAGCSVDIGYAYQLEDGRVVPYTSNRAPLADHYISRAGEQHWASMDWRHYRYVQLTFRNLAEPLRLHGVWAEAVSNHFERRGAFASDDAPILSRAFDMMARTADLNITDRTMDNASRERRQYLGDCSGIVPAVMSCFGDSALLRRYFANAREGQHATGQYRYSYPGHDDDRSSLFDHALSLPLRLWEHYMQVGDADLVREMWPGLARFLELAASCVDAADMMDLPPYAIWFDWGHMDRRGHFLPLQAMTAEVFRRAADLAEAAGEDGARYRELSARLTAQIPRWYDADRGVYLDAIVDGEQQPHFSEHAMSLLALWDLAPRDHVQAMLDKWAESPLAFGQTSPAWHYLPAAFFHAGRPELGRRWLDYRLGQIDAQGMDTWPETWCLYGERTLGTWRPRNSRAVSQGAGLGAAPALLQELAGIQPAAPGYAAVRLQPHPGDLADFTATQPTPDGVITLKMVRDGDSWRIDLQLPSPRLVSLIAHFASAADSVRVNGQQLAGESGVFRWQAERESSITIG